MEEELKVLWGVRMDADVISIACNHCSRCDRERRE